MQYDAIVIGAGQAGPGIAATFANEGQHVALIEGDKLGGTCLNYGCRPTKALRASARAAYMARRMAEFGVDVGEVRVDFSKVMRRKNHIIGDMQESLTSYFDGLKNLTVYHSYGRFIGTQDGKHQIQVGADILESEQVIVNTGARATIPPINGLDKVPYLTNVDILELKELPRHLLVVGGGYIGLEFGQMFRRFGSQVTIIESAPRIARNEDPDVSEAIADMLQKEAIAIYTGHRATAVLKTPDGGVQLAIKDHETGEEMTLTGSHLLIAVGRTPNSDNLHAETVGLEMDEKGYIKTNPKFETNVPGIWALGDVNGRGAFTHTSVQDYEIFLANRNGGNRSADERYLTYAMFIDPPLGRVGMNETEARESGRNVLMSVYPMSSVSRARLDSETEGLIKVLVDADSEEIIGALTFGMQGDDLVQIFSNFMYTGASYKVMRDALPIHPTIAEFIPTILDGLEPLN